MSQKEVSPHLQKQRPQEAIVGCWSRAKVAGRISAGHNGPMQCQILMTFRKWDLIFTRQGERSVVKIQSSR